jgi:hypothetical protein
VIAQQFTSYDPPTTSGEAIKLCKWFMIHPFGEWNQNKDALMEEPRIYTLIKNIE